MIGMLITGHGQFASGAASALELICGRLQNVEIVDFPSTDSVEDLEQHLHMAMDALAHCDGIMVFADLLGGSPFKSAVTLGFARDHVKVLAGSNLPVLIETNLIKDTVEDVDRLAEQAVKTAKEQVLLYEFKKVEEVYEEDGI